MGHVGWYEQIELKGLFQHCMTMNKNGKKIALSQHFQMSLDNGI